MIQYKTDKSNTYDGCIKKLLRSHNARYSDTITSKEHYVYHVKEHVLVGALYAHYFWDWVSISRIMAESKESLNKMMRALVECYQGKAVGIKTFTTVKKMAKLFVEAGFVLDKEVSLGHDTYYYFAYPLKGGKSSLEVHVREQASEEFSCVHDAWIEAFNKEEGILDVTDTFNMVALSEAGCVGGVQTAAYGDMLYVSRLVVDESLRGKAVGKTLMGHVLDFAREANLRYIMLGTTSFQARAFYEKCGYRVVYERKNCPKGESSYTMIHSLG